MLFLSFFVSRLGFAGVCVILVICSSFRVLALQVFVLFLSFFVSRLGFAGVCVIIVILCFVSWLCSCFISFLFFAVVRIVLVLLRAISWLCHCSYVLVPFSLAFALLLYGLEVVFCPFGYPSSSAKDCCSCCNISSSSS